MPGLSSLARLSLYVFIFCTWAAGAGVRVPFELHNDHIYLRIRINGHGPYYFLFDTGAGASGSMLDEALAQRLGLKEEGSVSAAMIGGGRRIKLTGPIEYMIGPLPFDEPRTALMPLADQAAEEHHQADGLFGYSLIKKYVIEVDYRRRVLTFYKPEEYRPPPRAMRLALKDLDSRKVPVVVTTIKTLSGREFSVDTILDTGYDGSLLLGRQLVADEKLEGYAVAANPKSGNGLGGTTTLKPGRIDALKIGSILLSHPATVFANDQEGNFSGPNAYIGGALLKRYKLVLNYSAGYLMLI